MSGNVTATVGDLFRSDSQTLVNTINCVGVMGKGIALGFKKRFPEMFKDYEDRCSSGLVRLGRPYLFKSIIAPWILNFPTKDHWRSVSRIEDIVRGLDYIHDHYKEWGISSLAVPPLGCGNGQLDWEVVGPTLYRSLSRLDIAVELYAPHGTPAHELEGSYLAHLEADPPADSSSRLNPAWVALVHVLQKIEEEPYHWQVGRTSFQKLTYFSTKAGIPTGLTFQKGSYGPYSPDLKRLITKLVNHGLIQEERQGRMFAVRVGQTFNDAQKAYGDHIDKWRAVLDRVADLFVRMNTKEAELAATVHFSAQELTTNTGGKPSEQEVLRKVLEWKKNRKPPLDVGEVAMTVRSLSALGWLDVKGSPDLPLSEPLIT